MRETLVAMILLMALAIVPLLVYFGLVPLLEAVTGQSIPFVPALLSTYLFTCIVAQSVTK